MISCLFGPCSCYAIAMLAHLFTWPMATLRRFIHESFLTTNGLFSLPFDRLFQDIRELIHPTDGRHAFLRAQWAAWARCLSLAMWTDEQIFCCQLMLWLSQHACTLHALWNVRRHHAFNAYSMYFMYGQATSPLVSRSCWKVSSMNVPHAANTKFANIMTHKFTLHECRYSNSTFPYAWVCWASLAKHASCIHETIVYLHNCVHQMITNAAESPWPWPQHRHAFWSASWWNGYPCKTPAHPGSSTCHPPGRAHLRSALPQGEDHAVMVQRNNFQFKPI